MSSATFELLIVAAPLFLSACSCPFPPQPLPFRSLTRGRRLQVQPNFLMELETKDGDGTANTTVLQAGGCEAYAVSHAQRHTHTHTLSHTHTDYANLQHMVAELEAAVAEARNKHSMRITRYIK